MEKKINKMSELHNKIQKSCCKKTGKKCKIKKNYLRKIAWFQKM